MQSSPKILPATTEHFAMQWGIIFFPLTMQKLKHNCTSSSPSSKASFGNSLLCKFDFDHLPKEILTYKYKHHETFYISNNLELKLTILMTKFTIKPLNSCRGTWWIIVSDCSISLQQQTRYMINQILLFLSHFVSNVRALLGYRCQKVYQIPEL